MIEIRDIEPRLPFRAQLQGHDDGQPVTLVNTFVAPEGRTEAVIDAWRKDSFVMKAQPGFVSAQLHRGIGDSRVLTNVAVWESLTALRKAFMNEDFQNLLPLYPDGSLSYPILVRKIAVAGVCTA
ncbi:antibiotic biosynthesis monooxygenase [Streptomyces sp. LP11]|uniref:Antibiotic biosynthesis monooxygenase n=1 Tax=Streptomyces pyxinicus TaxID=2970331 RepID=A0ABT2ATY4_9ACTN|nr:antibiotic biosynthesis monooxygenase family protein [Streptomyces sp. LP11]MCS0599713.1 antibiotic biosynthesis monooxygenase [Streptomyces sp. LP11]